MLFAYLNLHLHVFPLHFITYIHTYICICRMGKERLLDLSDDELLVRETQLQNSLESFSISLF